jgi:hypothetical protein
VVAGVSAFSVHDVVVKSLSGRYPLLEIIFVRSPVAVWPIGTLAVREGGLAGLSVRRAWGLAGRGLVGLGHDAGPGLHPSLAFLPGAGP